MFLSHELMTCIYNYGSKRLPDSNRNKLKAIELRDDIIDCRIEIINMYRENDLNKRIYCETYGFSFAKINNWDYSISLIDSGESNPWRRDIYNPTVKTVDLTKAHEISTMYKQGDIRLYSFDERNNHDIILNARKNTITELVNSKLSMAKFSRIYGLNPNVIKHWKHALNKAKAGVYHPWSNTTYSDTHTTEPKSEFESEPESEISMQSFTSGDQLRTELFNELAIEHERIQAELILIRHRMSILNDQWDTPIN